MTFSTIELSVQEGLARVVLNQPALGNPFNAAFCSDICALGNELSGRSDVRAILLTANGKFFSVGGDIRLFAEQLETLPVAIREWTSTLHMGIARLQRLNAPLVAAVHGTCMGGGVALIAGCDVVFAAESSRFGAAYPQIGYSCDAGSSYALASRMGVARARRFLVLNEMLTAQDAAKAGIADFVVADAELHASAEKMAVRLSRGPTRAYGSIRRLVGRALAQPFESQLEDEAQALAMNAASEDAREGITAFVEKREARFQGR